MSFHRTRRSLGQHFLIDMRAVQRIVAAIELVPGDAVIEIGPGHGALTEHLVRAAGRVVAVERDAALAAELRARFDPGQLVLHEADILQVDLASLHAGPAGRSGKLVVVGNLPYSISKPIAQKLIHERALIDRAVLMFQSEVAERLTARPGSRSYGPLTVLAGEVYRIETLLDLGPEAFRPRPKVRSTVTRWRRLPAVGLTAERELRLRGCLAACFAHRRRTLRNNLRAAFDDPGRADELLDRTGIDGALRAEALPPSDFLRLAEAWLL